MASFKITCTCLSDKPAAERKLRRTAWRILGEAKTYRKVVCDVCKATWYSSKEYTKFLTVVAPPESIDPTAAPEIAAALKEDES